MDQKVTDFFNSNKDIEHNKDMLSIPSEFIDNVNDAFDWIRHSSKCKSLRLDIDTDISEIKEEIRNKTSLAIPHRSHPGWRSLTLFGYSSCMTNSVEHYMEIGFDFAGVEPNWTDVSKFFPKTVSWLKKFNPIKKFNRIRIMVLDPGGASSPHVDYPYGQYLCGPVNVAIIHPYGAEFVLENGGLVPWKEGDFRTMDLGSIHCVRNIGQEERVHLIISPERDGWDNEESKELAYRSYLKQFTER